MVMEGTNVSDRISQALMNDPRTQDEVIEVASLQGLVTLSGKVASEATRRAAEEIARQQRGVISVVNEIKVR
jgi:osmotically-inducible protein OsmY